MRPINNRSVIYKCLWIDHFSAIAKITIIGYVNGLGFFNNLNISYIRELRQSLIWKLISPFPFGILYIFKLEATDAWKHMTSIHSHTSHINATCRFIYKKPTNSSQGRRMLRWIYSYTDIKLLAGKCYTLCPESSIDGEDDFPFVAVFNGLKWTMTWYYKDRLSAVSNSWITMSYNGASRALSPSIPIFCAIVRFLV